MHRRIVAIAVGSAIAATTVALSTTARGDEETTLKLVNHELPRHHRPYRRAIGGRRLRLHRRPL